MHWHQKKNCNISKIPKRNTEFWINKFKKYRARDRRNTILLEKLNWQVVVVWECDLLRNTLEILDHLIRKLSRNRNSEKQKKTTKNIDIMNVSNYINNRHCIILKEKTGSEFYSNG